MGGGSAFFTRVKLMQRPWKKKEGGKAELVMEADVPAHMKPKNCFSCCSVRTVLSYSLLYIFKQNLCPLSYSFFFFSSQVPTCKRSHCKYSNVRISTIALWIHSFRYEIIQKGAGGFLSLSFVLLDLLSSFFSQSKCFSW